MYVAFLSDATEVMMFCISHPFSVFPHLLPEHSVPETCNHYRRLLFPDLAEVIMVRGKHVRPAASKISVVFMCQKARGLVLLKS